MKKTCVVILSGGQDSTTCLYWALKHPELYESYDVKGKIWALTFDYGQKHSREKWCAKEIAEKAGIEQAVLHLTPLLGTSPLVSSQELGQYTKPEDLPGGVEPTFVPCRNIVFLTYAANYALYVHGQFNVGVDQIHLVTGVSQEDYGGYPDCRENFISSMEDTLNKGIFGFDDEWPALRGDEGAAVTPLTIWTPLLCKTKAQTVWLAREVGAYEALADTHTCYAGTETPCRKCHACIIRERGFVEAGFPDPLIVRHGLPWPPEWAE